MKICLNIILLGKNRTEYGTLRLKTWVGFILLTARCVVQNNAKDNLLLRFISEAYCIFSKVRPEYLYMIQTLVRRFNINALINLLAPEFSLKF